MLFLSILNIKECVVYLKSIIESSKFMHNNTIQLE